MPWDDLGLAVRVGGNRPTTYMCTRNNTPTASRSLERVPPLLSHLDEGDICNARGSLSRIDLSSKTHGSRSENFCDVRKQTTIVPSDWDDGGQSKTN
eukprot:758941-Hanusia_phi.AAC.2